MKNKRVSKPFPLLNINIADPRPALQSLSARRRQIASESQAMDEVSHFRIHNIKPGDGSERTPKI